MTLPFSAILFDCDGVLVDSELLTHGVFRDMLVELGWNISHQECLDRFVGKSFHEENRIIHEQTGLWLDDAWIEDFRDRRDTALRTGLSPVPGAVAAVTAVAAAMGDRFACASSADRRKIEMQLGLTQLDGMFGDRIFSGMEVPHSKPAPDVYLAAAEALGVDPSGTAVVEDSESGVMAGVAAGATVFGFVPPGRPYAPASQLIDAGAHHIFTCMSELPELLLGDAHRLPEGGQQPDGDGEPSALGDACNVAQ